MHVTRFYTTGDGGSVVGEFEFPITLEVPDAWGNTLRFSDTFACDQERIYEALMDKMLGETDIEMERDVAPWRTGQAACCGLLDRRRSHMIS